MIIGLLLIWTIGIPVIVLVATAIAARRRKAGPRGWAPPSLGPVSSALGGRESETPAAEDVGDGPQEDLEVEPQRPVGAV